MKELSESLCVCRRRMKEELKGEKKEQQKRFMEKIEDSAK